MNLFEDLEVSKDDSFLIYCFKLMIQGVLALSLIFLCLFVVLLSFGTAVAIINLILGGLK